MVNNYIVRVCADRQRGGREREREGVREREREREGERKEKRERERSPGLGFSQRENLLSEQRQRSCEDLPQPV